MSRSVRFMLLLVGVVFLLACNLVTRPIEDAQNTVSTVQAVATAMPLETLQAIATSLPMETLQAFASAVPADTAEVFGNVMDPQGEPVAVWKDIPIMPEASAGQDFDTIYSYKVDVPLKAIIDFYTARLGDLGWTSPFGVVEQSEMSIMAFTKGTQSLTITLTPNDGYVLVMIVLA